MREAIRRRFDLGIANFGERLAALRLHLPIAEEVDVVFWMEEDDRIILPKESSAEGGTSFKLFGFQKSAARKAVHHSTKQLIAMKGTRTGFTVLFAGIAAYHVAHEGHPVGWWQPDLERAQKFANAIWTPFFRDSEKLSPLVRKPIKGDTLDKWNDRTYTNGGRIVLSGAATDKAFSQETFRVTVGDEIDRWQLTSGGSDGNRIKLMWERSKSFWNRKLYAFSSPRTIGNSITHKQWLDSDQCRFFVACPCCGGRQYLEWGGPVTDEEDDGHGIRFRVGDDGIVEEVWYVCKVNGCILEESAKFDMDEVAGDTVYADDDPTPIDERLGWQPTAIPKRPGLTALHVPGYISLLPGANWTDLAQEWVDAQGKPEDLQTFWNNVLALPWEGVDAGKPIEVGSFEATRPEPYPAEIPQQTIHMTAYYDTQAGWKDASLNRKARHELTVCAFGPQEEVWVVGHFILDDYAPWSQEANRQLDDIVFRDWRKPDGSTMRILMCGYDASYSQTQALEFRRAKHRWDIYRPMKGENEEKHAAKAPLIARAKTDNARANDLMRVGTREGKEKADRMLKTERVGPGYVHFPKSLRDAVPAYFKGLFAERHVKDKDGGDYWVKSKWHANEPWDTFVGCLATLELCRLTWPNQVGREIDEAPVDVTRDRFEGRDRSVMAAIHEDLTLRQVMKDPRTSVMPPPRGMTYGNAANSNAAPARRRGGVIGGARFATRGRG
ncbi:terminase gpA endonuclease subunit [Devosia nitrariae]|uniref:Terminase n=1 Tax=Devosia nitrariae TaxID=2071872 RepID=A0ABQ5W0S4_9HYPH|nr:terminase gpA endonuclease subunit [Devosia nitrariae]GLQ53608.1 hypothetical protein GCM10010862_08670 [Devosia nitrariae]